MPGGWGGKMTCCRYAVGTPVTPPQDTLSSPAMAFSTSVGVGTCEFL